MMIEPKTMKSAPDKFHIGPDGTKYQFMREAVKDEEGAVCLSQLALDEIVIHPGFIYRWLP